MKSFRARVVAALLLAGGAVMTSAGATGPALSADDIAARAEALADARFGGRVPATATGEAAAHWIAGELARIGVTPANAGSYFQNVPVMAVTLDPVRSRLSFHAPSGVLSPAFGAGVVFWAPHYARDSVRLTALPVVFAGTGGEASYAETDVRGKAVLLLVREGADDADFCATAGGAFEAAARHGAAAVLAVAADGAGGCLTRTGPTRLWLRCEDKNGYLPDVEGWLAPETARTLFKAAGADFDRLAQAAGAPAFRAVPLAGVSLEAALTGEVRAAVSRNVVGFIPGGSRPQERVILSAPWDGAPAVPASAEGAEAKGAAPVPVADGRLGVAMLLDLAEKAAHDPVKPARSQVFLFPTLSTEGQLGLRYFADHPLWPLRNVVADYHLAAPAGAAAMNLAEFGRQDQQDGLIAALKVQGRSLDAAPPCRAGQEVFAVAGVPSVVIDSCGRAGLAADFAALARDEAALEDAVRALAEGETWPNWAADSPYRAMRDRLRLASYPAHPATGPQIAAADIAARAKALADDRFAGRAPDVEPGEAFAQWIADELKRIGVAPGARGHYLQAVTTVEIALDPETSSLHFETAKGALPSVYGKDALYWSPHYDRPQTSVARAPAIFAGYGILAPEAGRDDYAGIEVKGRTVVMLAGAPAGLADGDWYARPETKFAEAARRGARAVLIVPVADAWPDGAADEPRRWLLSGDRGGQRAAVEGWLRPDLARELFLRAGLDFAKETARAAAPDFRAEALAGASLSADLHSAFRYSSAHTVIGMLRGTRRPGDVLLFSAPWDGRGTVPEAAGEDKIFNGAVESANGVAMALELAEALAHGSKPARTVVFLFPAWSLARESGLEAFVRKPLWPLKHVAGAVGFGGMLPAASRDLGLGGGGADGFGRNGLEGALAAALQDQGRRLAPATAAWGGLDDCGLLPFAAAGVPVLCLHAGTDLVSGGSPKGEAAQADYFAHRFRRPGDGFDETWEFAGAARDLTALAAAAQVLADGESWPRWDDPGRFRTAGDALARSP